MILEVELLLLLYAIASECSKALPVSESVESGTTIYTAFNLIAASHSMTRALVVAPGQAMNLPVNLSSVPLADRGSA